jgi:two-component system cell cycle sensor histidine kinase/response regulator CckA
MAGGIAHDFNNLLVGILGYASLLADTGYPRDRPMASQIVLAAERAAELTKQMLAYSGKGSFVIEVLDLNALIKENLMRFRAAVSRGVRVELELGCDTCLVEGDRVQIHQAIMNLLINASEAVGDRPGEVRICTALIEGRESRFSSHLHEPVPAGNYALLEVRDNGAGMTHETVKKIFDPFFTTKFTGRGLGLAAVLGIVKGHRGDIAVESQPGVGAAFRIYLPLSERAGAARRQPEADAGAAATGQTVLVVDDEAIVRKLAALALERRGFRVLVANHGQEALDVLRSNPGISLVILDLTMPVMTGEQTLPVIRAMYPEIPVILSSGFNEAEISRRFASSGIAGVLQKPYTISGIVLKVVQAIQQAQPAQSRSSQA